MNASTDPLADHRLLEYWSDGEFLDHVIPFLVEGLAVGEPGMVVTTSCHIEAARAGLGARAAGEVRFADTRTWGSGNVPARVLAVDRAVRTLLATARRCRVVDEFAWTGDVQRRQWCRHEAAANLIRPPWRTSVLCPIDRRTSPDGFRAELRRAHPLLVPAAPNAEFADPWSHIAELDGRAHQDPPPYADTTVAAGDDDLRPMRQRVSAQARAAGLGEYQVQCVELAATEAVANAVHHARRAATIKTWAEDSRFHCEISDDGPGIADPLASYRPPEPAGGRCGLWLARTFCDDLEVLTSPRGTVLGMSFQRP